MKNYGETEDVRIHEEMPIHHHYASEIPENGTSRTQDLFLFYSGKNVPIIIGGADDAIALSFSPCSTGIFFNGL